MLADMVMEINEMKDLAEKALSIVVASIFGLTFLSFIEPAEALVVQNYIIIDGGIVRTIIVSDEFFSASISGQHQLVTPQIGTVHIGDTYTSGLYVSPIGSQSALEGSKVALSVNANSANSITYQWKKSGSAIDGATSSSLYFAAVASGDAGSYSCTVSDGVGTTTTPEATLTVR